MRYITEQELRDLFASGIPAHYTLPADAKLTPAARQYLMDLRLYRSACASRCKLPPDLEKPEDMTHLDAVTLVRKDDPRIVLRGKLDSLEADILCVQITAQKAGMHWLVSHLGDALRLVRQVLAADFKGEPLGDWQLGGLTPEAVHEASHHPKRFLPEGHVLPDVSQGKMAALLNKLRTSVRETEVQAVAAYAKEAVPRTDLIMALNRLSSYFYVLQLETIATKRGDSNGA